MPPKAAVAAVAPVEKRDGAKVAYVLLPLLGDDSVKVFLNTSCRADIFMDNALTTVAKEVSKRIVASESALAAAKALAAAQPDGPSHDSSLISDLLTRLKECSELLASASVASMDLVEVSNSAKVVFEDMAGSASEVVGPSRVYRLEKKV
jgi:hypothetical protein